MSVHDKEKRAANGKEQRAKECFISLRSPAENENTERVMPAWIAGIQVRKDASGNIRVNLDSSTPCWNDAIEGPLLKVTEVLLPHIFEGVFH